MIDKDEIIGRITEVLDLESTSYWVDKLGVSKSTINDRWRKGSEPKPTAIAQMCELMGISANWLILGVGPKNMADVGQGSSANDDQAQLIEAFRQNLPDHLKDNPMFENMAKVQALVSQVMDLVSSDTGSAYGKDLLITSLKMAIENLEKTKQS